VARRQRQAFTRVLDPVVASHLANMELKARLIVEGYIAVMHRIPVDVFSVEFS